MAVVDECRTAPGMLHLQYARMYVLHSPCRMERHLVGHTIGDSPTHKAKEAHIRQAGLCEVEHVAAIRFVGKREIRANKAR
jgi:hypothetical protein